MIGFTLTNGPTRIYSGIDDSGGGIFCEPLAVLSNCVLTGNSAYNSGGGASGGALYNCIVYYNTAPNDPNFYSGTLNYRCTTPDPGGAGNITTAPLFVNYAGGNLRLQSNSPCVNTGTNQNWMIRATDLDGNPRIRRNRVDMGAYESDYWGQTPPQIAVTPSSRNFGSIPVGTTADRTFSVQNTAGGTLSGSASVPAPYSIVSGGSYSLGSGASRTVTVRYSPTSAGTHNRTVTFTGGGGTTAPVMGLATNPPSGTMQFKSSTYSVSESSSSVRIYISRIGGSYGAARVNYTTSNGTAKAGSDFTARSGSLNWTSGDTADKFFDVPIINNSVYEGDERFTARLSGASGAGIGSPSSTTVTIKDDDEALVTVATTDATAGEPGTGQGSGTFTLESWPWVWTSGEWSKEFGASNLIDSDTNTLWIGNANGEPWRVILELGAVTDVSDLHVLFRDVAWTNLEIMGSLDAEDWFDFKSETNASILARYIYLNLWRNGGTNLPAIREIIRHGN